MRNQTTALWRGEPHNRGDRLVWAFKTTLFIGCSVLNPTCQNEDHISPK